jgi:hypothetical protein
MGSAGAGGHRPLVFNLMIMRHPRLLVAKLASRSGPRSADADAEIAAEVEANGDAGA